MWRERPFDGALRRHAVAVDLRAPTIAEIVAQCEGLPKGFAACGVARINGVEVPRAWWPVVRPRPTAGGETVVTLHMPLRGGGGGGQSGGGQSGGGSGKNIIGAVATIALVLVAAAVSGGLLAFGAVGATGPTLFLGAGTFGAKAAAAIIGIGGSLLIGALVPPPSLSLASPTAPGAQPLVASGPNRANPAAASLSGNILSPGAAIPRVVGTMRVFPPLFCQPLVEVVGDLEFVEVVLGLAGPHHIASPRAGGTELASILEADVQVVEGKPDDAIQTLVQRYGITQDVNAELGSHILDETIQFQLADQINPATQVPQAQVFTSRKAPDEIWINLAWPEGLFKTDDPTAVVNVAVRVQFRVRGTAEWVNCPEIHFSQNSPGGFQKVVRLKWGAIPVNKSTPPANKGPVYAFKHVPGQAVAPATSGWEAHGSFSSGAGGDVLSASTVGTTKVVNTELYDDKVIFYLDPELIPQDVYEVNVTRSSVYLSSSFVPATYAYAGTVRDFFHYYLDAGVARVPVDHGQFRHRAVMRRLASVWNDNPVQTRDFATVSVRVHSRSLDQISVLASGLVKDWDGAGWNGLSVTSNPAPHYRDVLTGSLGGSPLHASVVDDAEMVAWRQHAIDRGYTVDAVLEGRSYVDALNVIAAAGFARPRHNEKWGVFLDKDRSADAPVQVFTPRNMKGFNWSRAFPRRPSGVRGVFHNAALDYERDHVIVYDDDANQDDTRLDEIPYDGIVDRAKVIARIEYDLAQSRHRFAFYEGQSDIESIVCQRGDLVGVQHDILMRHAGAARVKAVTVEAGQVTALSFDGSAPVFTTPSIYAVADIFAVTDVFELGRKTGVAIRLKNGGGTLIAEIAANENGERTAAQVVTPFADPGDAELGEGCLCAFGPLGSEYKRMLVFAMRPRADGVATITFVDEAPQLFEAA